MHFPSATCQLPRPSPTPVNSVFVNEAPVLQRGDDFYTTSDLFPGGTLDENKLGVILSGA